MKYKLIELNQTQGWIEIEVDFEDSSPKYTKRMMADTSSEEGIDASVSTWASDYLPNRPVAKPNLTSLKGRTKTVTIVAKDALAEAIK